MTTTSPRDNPPMLLVTFACGLLFGFGLAYATMIRPESVLNFLTFRDFGLMLVLGTASGISLLMFQFAPRLMRKPPLGYAFERRPFALNRGAVAGGALFGLGWGISGVCPGSALAGVGTGNAVLLLPLAGIFFGAWLHGIVVGGDGG
ncbi:MAG: YeeE/YedE family protein [Rhodocyclaceae bacterium]|nr:YeeE/YedE family protein [Rhodocyclaceae bacterium]